jgi:hypothetical protein
VFTQSLTEISARSRKIMFLGIRARPVVRADNPAAICEPIVQTMWDGQRLTTLYPSKACYGDTLTFTYLLLNASDKTWPYVH